MNKSHALFDARALRFSVRYLRYVAWQVFALTAKFIIYLLFACYLLALLATTLLAVCAPFCAVNMCFGASSGEAAFAMSGLCGTFLVLLIATAGLRRVIEEAAAAPAGSLLHPMPPQREGPLPDAEALLRASMEGGDLLLRALSAPPPATNPALLLRALNPDTSALP